MRMWTYDCEVSAYDWLFVFKAKDSGEYSIFHNDNETMSLFLNDEDLVRLEKKGAVGDICSHVIDMEGRICEPELDERTVAIPLDVIKSKPYRIGVAQGIPVWQTGAESLFPGLSYVIFPGNVGGTDTLREIVEKLS